MFNLVSYVHFSGTQLFDYGHGEQGYEEYGKCIICLMNSRVSKDQDIEDKHNFRA